MKKLFSTLLILTATTLAAQDTLSILSYNVLNYPVSNPTKADTLVPIIKLLQPDIFMITELTSSSGATTILNTALNINGITFYQKATYFDGPDTDNMLFYNSDKLVLKSQFQIATTLRDISEYVLYYKDPNIAMVTDTIFLYCYMAHLKASTGAANEQQRNQEAVVFKNYLDSKSAILENVFFGGDFNLYTSSEPAHNTILNGGNVPLFDPISSPGNWSSNSSFASIHTQSTRSNSLPDGGAFGGMDDRFDFIFTSGDVLNGSKGISYINNTYKALGNDGNHFNKSINATPTNTAVPANVADALYTISDHLPVFMKVAVDLTVGINEQTNIINWKGYVAQKQFYFTSNQVENKVNVLVYNVLGELVVAKNFNHQNSFQLNLNTYNNGLYVVKVIGENQQKSFKVFKK